MRPIMLLILLLFANNSAIAEGKNEDLTVPSKDEAVCVQQIQPIIDLWKQNERTTEDANRLREIQKAKGNCAARDQYRHMLGFN